MATHRTLLRAFLGLSLCTTAGAALPASLWAQPAVAAAPKATGTVKSIDGSTFTVTTAAGTAVVVTVSATAPVLQLAPGSTDLKTATPGTFASIAVGDRVLVNGTAGDAATALNAARVVLIKSSDITARQSAQQADWQRNGVGGLVRGVDGATLTVVAGARTLKVQTTDKTIFRRYADDSVKFEDAKGGKLDQVQTGDQISVRGPKSDDGLTITAEEVVTGTFQNLSGAISSVDAVAGTVTLKDLISKKTAVVHVTPNSDLRKLPAQAAAAFATRNAPGAAPAAGPAGAPAAGAGGGRRAGMDLSRMLARLPTEPLTDLKPGDAVMIVASAGRGDSLTAITMLSGVEQLLSATPAGAQPITLSPWTLGVPEGAGGAP